MSGMRLMPMQQDNSLQTIGMVAGGIVGAAGGPAGILAGAAAGGSYGGMAKSLLGGNTSTGLIDAGPSDAAAMARRNAQLAQNNLATLQTAESNLAYLPENLRQQVAPTIITARMMAEQQGGIA